MGRASFAILIACLGMAASAHAATTQQFFDLCGNDEEACAKRIDEVRGAAEKSGAKFCAPTTMSREGYANEVTYWIGEQPSLDMKQDDAKSIIAALTALYSCKPSQGQKP